MKIKHHLKVKEFAIKIPYFHQEIHPIDRVAKLFGESEKVFADDETTLVDYNWYPWHEDRDDPMMTFWFKGKPTKKHTLLAMQVDSYEVVDAKYHLKDNLFDEFFEVTA